MVLQKGENSRCLKNVIRNKIKQGYSSELLRAFAKRRICLTESLKPIQPQNLLHGESSKEITPHNILREMMIMNDKKYV